MSYTLTELERMAFILGMMAGAVLGYTMKVVEIIIGLPL